MTGACCVRGDVAELFDRFPDGLNVRHVMCVDHAACSQRSTIGGGQRTSTREAVRGVKRSGIADVRILCKPQLQNSRCEGKVRRESPAHEQLNLFEGPLWVFIKSANTRVELDRNRAVISIFSGQRYATAMLVSRSPPLVPLCEERWPQKTRPDCGGFDPRNIPTNRAVSWGIYTWSGRSDRVSTLTSHKRYAQ